VPPSRPAGRRVRGRVPGRRPGPVRAAPASPATRSGGRGVGVPIGLICDNRPTPGRRGQPVAWYEPAPNASGLAFVFHDGDIWKGGTPAATTGLPPGEGPSSTAHHARLHPRRQRVAGLPQPGRGGCLPPPESFFAGAGSLRDRGPDPPGPGAPGPPVLRPMKSRPLGAGRCRVRPPRSTPARARRPPPPERILWPGFDGRLRQAARVKAPALMIIWQDDPDRRQLPIPRRPAQSGGPPPSGSRWWLVHGDNPPVQARPTPGRQHRTITPARDLPRLHPQWVKRPSTTASRQVVQLSTRDCSTDARLLRPAVWISRGVSRGAVRRENAAWDSAAGPSWSSFGGRRRCPAPVAPGCPSGLGGGLAPGPGRASGPGRSGRCDGRGGAGAGGPRLRGPWADRSKQVAHVSNCRATPASSRGSWRRRGGSAR